MTYDLVSDLHVDYWTLEHKYDWKKNKTEGCKGVIIAGDIADTLDITVEELNKACDVYDVVMYVDGNHEATHHYDDLGYVSNIVSKAMKDRRNFYNLSKVDFIDEETNTVFIGACAWWDFKICEPEISHEEGKKNMSFDWNPNKALDSETIIQNIVNAAYDDYVRVKNRIEQYNGVRDICVVTHTVPHKELISQNYPLDRTFASYYGNSLFQEFFNCESVKTFIYGHNHDSVNTRYINGKLCVSNPRGRPQDYNRVNYTSMRLQLC